MQGRELWPITVTLDDIHCEYLSLAGGKATTIYKVSGEHLLLLLEMSDGVIRSKEIDRLYKQVKIHTEKHWYLLQPYMHLIKRVKGTRYNSHT